MGLDVMISQEQAIAGHGKAMPVPEKHQVLGTPLTGPWPEGVESIVFGMGCFWGAERLFWKQHGVYSTAVGYAGGFTANAGYKEVCSGYTGHAEVVLVVFQPHMIKLEQLLSLFWEEHDPTQGMRQGNDKGTQYRSAIYTNSAAQFDLALQSKEAFQKALQQQGYSQITTEIKNDVAFYYAEPEHQQYLAKNPWGYCGLQGTGVKL